MKNIFKKVFIILNISCLLLLTACNSTNKKSDNVSPFIASTNESLTNDATQKKIGTESNDNMTVQTESENSSVNAKIAPVANKEISIYTLNDATLEVEAAVALIPENTEITPELIVDLVSDSLADRSVFIGIDEITTEKDAVIVSFLSDQPPVVQMGSSVEATILDAIAQSLVDNLDEYTKVIFRVEGGPYATGHFEFGLNEVYLDSSK